MPRFAKWTVTVAVGLGVFALTWWVCAGPLAMDTGQSLTVAGVLATSMSSPFAWWAGRDPQPLQASPIHHIHHVDGLEQVPHVEPVAPQLVVGPVPREPQHFQSRPAEVDQLWRLADSGEVAVVGAVTGQRGVGKTQVAGVYARQRIATGWSVAWVPAENANLVLAGLVELADTLGLGREDDTAATAAERVRSHLQTRHEPTLVVFDNVTDPAHVTPYLPATGNVQIVLTSASHAVERVGTAVPVGLFSPEVAVDFLMAATGVPNAEGARALADELGCLPLALAQAAARIATVERDYVTYLDRLRAVSLDKYLKAKPGAPYPHGAAEAILLAVEPFTTSEAHRERDFLELFSVLSPDGVSRALLATAQHADAEHDDVLETLLEASLVEFAGGTNNRVVVMHRLTQRVIRHQAHTNLHTVIDSAADFIGDATFLGLEAWPHEICDELVRHIDTLWHHTLTHTCPPTTVNHLLTQRNWAVRYLVDTEIADRAIDLATAVYIDHHRLLGPDNPGTLYATSNLASAFLEAGKLGWYEETIAERRRVLEDTHPGTLASIDALIDAYKSVDAANQGQTDSAGADLREAAALDDAIPTAERALAGSRKALGDTHPVTLSLAINLIYAYGETDRYEEAIRLFERVLADCRETLGDAHPITVHFAGHYVATEKSK